MIRNSLNIFRKKDSSSEISLIPLINIIFLLLIFFMIAGTLRQSDRLPVALPKVSVAEKQEVVRAEIYLTISNGEIKIAVNQDIVQWEDINKIINTLMQSSEKKELIIKADQGFPAYRLIKMIERLKGLGVKTLLLAAEVKT